MLHVGLDGGSGHCVQVRTVDRHSAAIPVSIVVVSAMQTTRFGKNGFVAFVEQIHS
jgi:hypothetical protein